MFIYLSKKIAIPNNTRLNCIAWSKEEGYVAVGGEDGLLKVLKLEQATVSTTQTGKAHQPSNLSMNQSLEGHKSSVNVVTWNEVKQKLTSSDKDGIIMVWMMYKGSWFEEMTNDRKKSTVKGMAWTSDGQKICIVYEDGTVIVGSVDGNRIWGKDLKNVSLTGVQWSPDGRLLLFSIKTGELHLYDNQGIFVMKLNIQCVYLTPAKSITVVGLSWYHDAVSPNRPVLAVCYENGKMQIMRNENDDLPVILDTNMQNIACMWNHDGTIIAVCGMKTNLNDKETNQVLFYTPYGVHIRTLKIPGKEITSLSWEGKSLRIALSVDSFIYFANIRPDYTWCYFNKTVCYLEATKNEESSIVTFWDTNSNQCYSKHVDPVLVMVANVDHCVLAVETKISAKEFSFMNDSKSKDFMYQLLVCNSISTTVDSKYIDIRPNFVAMNSVHVIVASKDQFMLWHYHTPKGASSLHSNVKAKADRKYHIDDTPALDVLNDLDANNTYDIPSKTDPSQDPICCIAASENLLLVGRESGLIHEYTLPHLVLRNRHYMQTRSYKMAINCNSTRAALIDCNGILTTIVLREDTDESQVMEGRVERKDVWAICWAQDNPELLAIMEKTRMYILRGADPEEPITCSGYICNFEDLEITGVLLDEIIKGNATPNVKEHILQLRVKSLRDTEDLLSHVGIAEAKQFIEDNSHPRLWRLLAEASLKKLDLETAEAAFVRCSNYPGIQFIKRLKSIQVEALQKSEIYSFFGDFDEAEKMYIDVDRRDLAISLRQTLCDWFRTVQLYKMGPGISDQQMEHAWREIGHHFMNLRAWESAKEYYDKAHHIEGLMDTLYHLEQYDELVACMHKLPEKSHHLAKLGQMMATVGMCEQSVAAYLKHGDVKSAVSTCIGLRQWGLAVELAQKYKMPQISALLSKHAAQLLQEGKLPEAIELQKKAGRFLDAARLLVKMAESECLKKSDFVRIKQLYVLSGLLAEEHIEKQILLTGGNRASVLSQMNPEDSVLIEHIWHNAEAYHYMLLAQRHLRSGLVHSAVITALRLREYEDVLDVESLYSLLALASCADRSFGTCSKAFIKLEDLESLPEARRQQYEELAINIFSRYEPKDGRAKHVTCFTCETSVADCSTYCPNCGSHFPPCTASGQPLTNPTGAWQCSSCYHVANPLEITTRKTCPLCHSVIETKAIVEV
ncbi:WD repeat-containing protein 35 [Toxorhynchites rutilus septentrionalis]|uniref:WD repeat-containing protein 35 n=1 Tax=Toxorhynchites rutilus septentrionalis TaxID=329112 RepID=UPI0024796830|nr:WD repeat-containing protein 35 [Toxorhynchites rutilus septentrionalis]